jgi:hypothetical protein
MFNHNYSTSSGVCEITEEEVQTINHHQIDDNEIEEEECVYVAVGKSDTSMEALSWTLNNLISNHHSTNTMLYLIHVFPEIKHIPHPCK